MGNWRFGAFPKLPYSTMQQLNLDWILDRIRRFLPDNGTKGQVLTRTKDGAAWQDVSAVAGGVNSVNGKTGDVVLNAADVGALPSSYQAPVTSVNDRTGAVQLTIPDSTSDLTNDSGFITAAQASAAAPVQSVNGQTGDVSVPGISALDVYPVGSIYMSVNSTSPATLFGGTWEQLQDCFLLGAGTTYAAGETGGEAEHTLTDAELPKTSGSFSTRRMSWGTGASQSSAIALSPSGNVSIISSGAAGQDSVAYFDGVSRALDKVTFSFGSDAAHNNMPPYLAVYMWKRTA